MSLYVLGLAKRTYAPSNRHFAQEALGLGIPEDALPKLGSDPALEEVKAAQRKLQGIMESFTSANI